jgi:hypothetical protein
MFGRLKDDHYPINPVQMFNLSTYSWSVYDLPSVVPQPVTRGGHAASNVVINTSTAESVTAILLTGGENQFSPGLGMSFRDAWQFSDDIDDPSKAFYSIQAQERPQTRLSHTATELENKMCIFGGIDLASGFQNEIWCLEFSNCNTTGVDLDSKIDTSWRHLPVRSPPNTPYVRCALLDRCLHSFMPLVPTPARLKLFRACGQWYSARVFTLLPVVTVHCIQPLKDDALMPPRRADHSAVFLKPVDQTKTMHSGGLVVYGGQAYYSVSQTTAPLNDMYSALVLYYALCHCTDDVRPPHH